LINSSFLSVMKYLSYYLRLLLVLWNCHDNIICKAEDLSSEDEVKISPKCAAVVVGGASVVAAVTAFMAPHALCTAGFCQTGVPGGSFASWWQSTMPSNLQSIAMGGGGSMAGLQSIIGLSAGSTVALYLHDFCVLVDEADPDSALGMLIETNYYTVTTALQTAEMANDRCGASETCTAAKEMISYAASTVIKTAGGLKNEAEEQCAASETCTAGREKAKEIFHSASKTASSWWVAAKEGAAAVANRISEIAEEVENERKELKADL
jgi:hypothetical protein